MPLANASEFSDKCLSGLIVNQFGRDQGSRRRQPTSDIQCPLYVAPIRWGQTNLDV